MKALWLVSFRPIGKSISTDLNQSIFVDSIKKIRFDITFSLTQFEEKNVKEFIDNKNMLDNVLYQLATFIADVDVLFYNLLQKA